MNQIGNFQHETPAAAAPEHLHDPLQPVPNPLPKLLTGEDLPSEDAAHLAFEIGLEVGVVQEVDVGQVAVVPEGLGVPEVRPLREAVLLPVEPAHGHPHPEALEGRVP